MADRISKVKSWGMTAHGPAYVVMGLENLTSEQLETLDSSLKRWFLERRFAIHGNLAGKQLWIFGDRNDTYPDLVIERLGEDCTALCDLGPARRKGLLYFKNLLKSIRRRYNINLALVSVQVDEH